ncbi:thioredoxin domain-containing protein [bacterium]|nr:thioredoxin domain-containing protein [bacterium]
MTIKTTATQPPAKWQQRLIFFLIPLGFIISAYLLYMHISPQLGMGGGNLCSMLFGNGCDAALMTTWSAFLGVPLAAWGITYYVTLSLILLFYRLTRSADAVPVPGIAVFIGVMGAAAGIALLVIMLGGWSPFCAFCAIEHGLNLVLAWLLLRANGEGVLRLLGRGWSIIRDFFAGTEKLSVSQRLSVAGVSIALVVAIGLYQWAYIIEQSLEIGSLQINEQAIVRDLQLQRPVDIPIDSTDAILGDPTSTLKVVLFSDFECPSCRKLAKELMRMSPLFDQRAMLVFKNMPLGKGCNPALEEDIHPKACLYARAAEVARQQGKFWEYHDDLFNAAIAGQQPNLITLATNHGIDSLTFVTQLDAPETAAKVRRDVELALKLGINGTPALYINGAAVNDIRPRSVHFLLEHIIRTREMINRLPVEHVDEEFEQTGD